MWWKLEGILIQWFSELYFHFFLRISAILIIFFNVIDLSYQIIKFGKDCDDRYWKNVHLPHKLERWYDRNLSLPSLSQRTSIPAAIEAENCSEQNKTFHRRTDDQWPLCTLR